MPRIKYGIGGKVSEVTHKNKENGPWIGKKKAGTSKSKESEDDIEISVKCSKCDKSMVVSYSFLLDHPEDILCEECKKEKE